MVIGLGKWTVIFCRTQVNYHTLELKVYKTK